MSRVKPCSYPFERKSREAFSISEGSAGSAGARSEAAMVTLLGAPSSRYVEAS